MKKTFCDGCDRGLKADHPPVYIAIYRDPLTTNATLPLEAFDLCEGCETVLKSRANPKSWPRSDRSTSA